MNNVISSELVIIIIVNQWGSTGNSINKQNSKL